MPLSKINVIGITGGIGAGKSVVSRILRCNGYFVYDCDSRARDLMEHDEDLKASLILELGEDIYNDRGELDRKKLGAMIFTDSSLRDKVNTLVHSAVREDIMEEMKNTPGWFFIESAILATGGIQPFCTEIWIVKAPEALRIKRVEERDGLSEDEIRKRIESQQHELDRLDKAKEEVIVNDDCHPMLKEVLEKVERNLEPLPQFMLKFRSHIFEGFSDWIEGAMGHHCD